jgi:hypothetical protein
MRVTNFEEVVGFERELFRVLSSDDHRLWPWDSNPRAFLFSEKGWGVLTPHRG